MKKKVISLFVTGMLAVSMIAGCGSDNTADTSTSADTTADASTDASRHNRRGSTGSYNRL